MTISNVSGTHCTATLPGTSYEVRCEDSTLCVAGSCTPYSYDGRYLAFGVSGGASVTCSP